MEISQHFVLNIYKLKFRNTASVTFSSTSILSSPTTSRNKSSAVQLKKKVSFLSSVSSTSVLTQSPSVSASSLLTPQPPPPGVRHDDRTLDLEQTIKRKKILACSSSSLELQHSLGRIGTLEGLWRGTTRGWQCRDWLWITTPWAPGCSSSQPYLSSMSSEEPL